MERLDKILSAQGALTRSEAGRAIRCGRVTVDGKVCRQGAQKIDPDKQTVALDGRELNTARFVYWMLNKPAGILCVSRDPKVPTVVDLLPAEHRRRGLFPAGRLDKDTHGLVLITDDGDLANKLTHPGHDIAKVYRVKVAEAITREQLDALRAPMTLDGYEIEPVEVDVSSVDESGSVLKMTLYEGRNRQIRQMCAEVGLTVKRLSRVSIGRIKLNNLAVGHYRHLTEEEVEYLKRAAEKKRPRRNG
jgi:pseudouridine synthase